MLLVVNKSCDILDYGDIYYNTFRLQHFALGYQSSLYLKKYLFFFFFVVHSQKSVNCAKEDKMRKKLNFSIRIYILNQTKITKFILKPFA